MHSITLNLANPCANQSSKISLDFCLILYYRVYSGEKEDEHRDSSCALYRRLLLEL